MQVIERKRKGNNSPHPHQEAGNYISQHLKQQRLNKVSVENPNIDDLK